MTEVNAIPNETAKRQLVITYEVNAPREQVFAALTEAAHLGNWWGPKGSKIEVERLDLRPGGLFHYSLEMPEASKFWGRFKYVDIDAPERLVYVSSFADENGEITRAPFAPAFPLEVHSTLILSENNGKTLLTLTGGPINETDEERNFFESMLPSMEQGFAGTFDKLEEYLSKQ